MKKVISFCLALMLLFSLVGCQNTPASTEAPTDAPTDAPTEAPTEAPAFTGSLSDLIAELYKKTDLGELSMGDPQSVDLSDEYQVTYFLGLSSTDKVQEAMVSEPMIGSIAYSLVAVRVKDASDAVSVAEEMAKGINTRKWVCVEADALHVAAKGDLVLLYMVDSSLFDVPATDMIDHFEEIVGTLDYRK